MGLAKFGISLLDEALGGGIPRGSVVLLEEEMGTKSDYFFAHFLAISGLLANKNFFCFSDLKGTKKKS